MSYTERDIENASRYAEYNVRVRTLRRLMEKAPHLASWLDVRVRDATADDYYVPTRLKATAKVMEVRMTKTLCEMLSCNPSKERGMCRPTDAASYYRVGDDGFDLQCQPSCFNTASKATYDKDGARVADVPHLNWYRDSCRIVNSGMISWLEKTYYRSTTHYEFRLNDMPTGFSRVPENSNPYGTGFTYRPNATYCRYYDRSIESDGSCKMELWEYILDAVIGSSLINTVRSAVRVVVNGGQPFDDPKDLPPMPASVPKRYATIEGWRANVNASFVVPPLLEADASATASFDLDDADADADADPTTSARRRAERRQVEYERSVGTAETTKGRRSVAGRLRLAKRIDARASADADDDAEPPEHWTEKMYAVFQTIADLISDKDFWIQTGIDTVTGVLLAKLKKLLLKVVERLSVVVSRGLLQLTGSIGVRVITAGVKSLMLRMVVASALRIGAKLAIMMAKFLAAVASVVGWVLLIVMFVDLMFTFWDPFGYNNLFPPELPRDIMAQGELALRQALEAPMASFEYDSLVNTLLSQDEMLEIQINALVDRVKYLDALIVNSEGSRIDKGDEIDVGDGSSDEIDRARERALSRRVRFDAATFDEYNRRFYERVDMKAAIDRVAYGLAGAAIVAGTLTRLNLVTIMLVVASVAVLCASRLALQSDILLDAWLRLRSSAPVISSKLTDDTAT